MSIEMARLRTDLESHQRSVAFQVDAYKVACESLEMQRMDYQRPHPKGERRASVNRAGVSPPPLSKKATQRRNMMGREPVQKKLYAPLVDFVSDTDNRVPVWASTVRVL